MVTFASAREALTRIAPYIIRTPVVYSPTFSKRCGCSVYLKLETLQKAGSFKVRGATNKILCNPEAARRHGVVAASAGNHAQGVAVAAHRAGVQATIVMPVWASLAKQEATRAYGARTIIEGQTLEECVGRAQALSETGMLFIHPYDDEQVIAGQATIGLEILEDLPETDVIIAPVGGGGLIAGIATAARTLRPSCRIIGVQSESCPSVYEALRTGQPVCVLPQPSLADGIRVAQAGSVTLPIIRSLVDRIVLVGEDAIADAMLELIERKKIVSEGAGAVPLAALLGGAIPLPEAGTVVLVISGGNIDTPLIERTIHHALMQRGRIFRCTVVLDDRPGALARLLFVVAQEQGNILGIHHGPGEAGPPVHAVRILLEIETRGREHAESIAHAMERAGYHPILPA